MNFTINRNYITPEIELVNLEMEQSVLSASVEPVGKKQNEIDW